MSTHKDRFIKLADSVYGWYDYSNIEFTGMMHPIDILCPLCGNTFNVTPNAHINLGAKCPFCDEVTKAIQEPDVKPVTKAHKGRQRKSKRHQSTEDTTAQSQTA